MIAFRSRTEHPTEQDISKAHAETDTADVPKLRSDFSPQLSSEDEIE